MVHRRHHRNLPAPPARRDHCRHISSSSALPGLPYPGCPAAFSGRLLASISAIIGSSANIPAPFIGSSPEPLTHRLVDIIRNPQQHVAGSCAGCHHLIRLHPVASGFTLTRLLACNAYARGDITHLHHQVRAMHRRRS
ncbi:hypothetical protein NPIL_472771 [Nephila pilipes]|uniref:Uncharacterized protein n=1 Tax=Nephila pilipes TaxID=299642 RepID=A0A8X6QZH8_NEPPI|nr:hypothetical protein NPIL_472771 [Nephila pilipes]